MSQVSSFDLNQFLSAQKQSVEKCLGVVEYDAIFNGVTATSRFHYLKFDGNGQPLISSLAEVLYSHIIDYCIAARNRNSVPDTKEMARYVKEARKLFIHPAATEDDPDGTGEAGEMLLYLLIEGVLNAPQVVAKMELKTNHSDEVKGSDGIHMRWNEKESIVEIIFGESKIHQDLSGALSKAIKSIETFHSSGMLEHEFVMVTKHFKYADPNVQKVVKELFESGVPAEGVRIHHACLIGYGWDEYPEIQKLENQKRLAKLQESYLNDCPRLTQLLQKRFTDCSVKHLVFEIFFLPFPAVQAFRDAFNNALT